MVKIKMRNNRSDRKKKCFLGVLMVAFVLCLFELNGVQREDLMNNEGRSFEKGVVTEILQDNLQDDNTRIGRQKVKVHITRGEHKGEIIEATSTSGYLYGADCTPGLKVIVTISEYGDVLEASIYNYDREGILYLIVALFCLVLWMIGGKKGLMAVGGLAFTLLCVIWLFLPMIYRGVSPILAATIMAVIVTVVVMYLIAGFSQKAACAILGTIGGVLFAAIFAFLFGKAARISGNNVSDIENLLYIGQVTEVKVGELLFAGILISALGAVMDVAISVASAIWEIHLADERKQQKELFQAGMNVGRDMMGTMSNTLILAFAGNAINTLVYLYCYNYRYYQIINMYSIGIEIIQGIAATLGVVLTVPLVAVVASYSMAWKKREA